MNQEGVGGGPDHIIKGLDRSTPHTHTREREREREEIRERPGRGARNRRHRQRSDLTSS